MEKKQIVDIVEELVWSLDVTYFEAVMIFSEKYNIDVETLAGIISSLPALKESIYKDAEKLNLVEKVTRIDVSV